MFCLTLLSDPLSKLVTRLVESAGEMPEFCWWQLLLQQSLYRQMLRPFLDRDMCSAPLVVLLYFLAPYCLETERGEPNTNFSMIWVDLLSAATSRSELYLRRATPVGAPATASNLHLVGRYVGDT